MAIRKAELYRLVDRLNQQGEKAAFDFLEFLIERSIKTPKDWKKIDKEEPEYELLSNQELEQLNSEEGYVSEEDEKIEFGLKVDLP